MAGKPDKDPKTVGEALRALRKAKGLTIWQVGEQLGWGQSYVGGAERGEFVPTVERLEKFAAFYGVAPSSLRRFVSEVAPEDLPPGLEEFLGSEEAADLAPWQKEWIRSAMVSLPGPGPRTWRLAAEAIRTIQDPAARERK